MRQQCWPTQRKYAKHFACMNLKVEFMNVSYSRCIVPHKFKFFNKRHNAHTSPSQKNGLIERRTSIVSMEVADDSDKSTERRAKKRCSAKWKGKMCIWKSLLATANAKLWPNKHFKSDISLEILSLLSSLALVADSASAITKSKYVLQPPNSAEWMGSHKSPGLFRHTVRHIFNVQPHAFPNEAAKKPPTQKMLISAIYAFHHRIQLARWEGGGAFSH